MRLRVLAAVLCAALGVAACGASNRADDQSSPSSSTASPPSTAATAPQQTYTYTTTTTTTTATATTAPSPATVTTATITAPDSGGAGLTSPTATAAACVAADLTPTAAPPNGATGTVVLGFTVKNTGSAACSTYGWPGIAFVDASGTAVSTPTTRTTRDILGATPPTKLVIAAGGEASFRVTVHDSNDQGGEAGCGSFATVQIIAPNDTAAMRVKLPDGPAEVCGAAAVSPLEPGTSATGQ